MFGCMAPLPLAPVRPLAELSHAREEKRQLYRDITDQIRHDVIRLHAEALEEAKAADAAGKKS